MISRVNILTSIPTFSCDLAMPPEEESRLFDQLKARIEEYNQKDRQAVIRAKEERDKWLQIRCKAKDRKSSNS
jgi:hypothetical protein